MKRKQIDHFTAAEEKVAMAGNTANAALRSDLIGMAQVHATLAVAEQLGSKR